MVFLAALLLVLLGFYLLKIIALSVGVAATPPFLLIFLIGLLLIVAFRVSIMMWKWYDKILDIFSLPLRIFDIITWFLLLWICLSGFQRHAVAIPMVGPWEILSIYFNIYSWGVLTIVGFIIIGAMRLFIKKRILG